jgi:hypothetical protein
MAGHQRTADTPAGGRRADTPASGGQAETGGGARKTNEGNTCLRYGGREDTEGTPTRRQGKVYQQIFPRSPMAAVQVRYSSWDKERFG